MKPVAPPFSRVRREPVLLLACGFGSGLAPRAPGTAGSLAALAVAVGASPWLAASPTAVGLILAAAILGGIAICGEAARRLAAPDHPAIVWDEFAGLWLTLAFVPHGLGGWIAGFVAFRFFDIVKPWPIAWIDRRGKGGLGIMADDLAAGVLAGLAVRAAGALL